MGTFKKNTAHIIVDAWGNLACFTRPENGVERLSYPCITPSAARGVLSSIYMKPLEFYYEIEKVEIINNSDSDGPHSIKYINFYKNERKNIVKVISPVKKASRSGDLKDNDGVGRTQRNTLYLRDVYYRIYAKIIKRTDCSWTNINALYEQFDKRLKKGKCFSQPYFGLRECVCHFSEPNWELSPNKNLNLDIGFMLYDVFDITNNVPLPSGKGKNDILNISFFHAEIKNGVLEVPAFNSPEIRRSKNVQGDI